MQTNQMNFGNYKTGIVELKGGINENVSSLELQAGELIDCKNYMIAEGGYGGYISTKGYERFDGQYRASTYESLVLNVKDSTLGVTEGDIITQVSSGANCVSLETVSPTEGYLTVQCLKLTDGFVPEEELSVPLGTIGNLDTLRELTGATSEYHLAADWVTAQVTEVPGEGRILGLHIYEGLPYAFRKKVGLLEVGLYVATPTGWTEVSTAIDPIVYEEGEHLFFFSNYNFKATDGGYSMFWCDGVNKARMCDGVTVTTIDNSGMGANDKPTRILAHNYHLWLAYPGGSLQHSKVGDPEVWDATLGAGEIGVGAEITNLEVGVQSSLVIMLEDGIRILTGNVIDNFILEVFSQRSGAISRTAQRLLGTIFFLDDRGLSTLEAVQDYGDYSANSISQRFKRTLLDTSHKITCTTTSRDLNQYRIFFDDAKAIYVSFEGREFKGATFMEFDRPICNIAHGDIETKDTNIFSSTDDSGYVYLMDSGKSFDGMPIVCRMATAYYHYGSPRGWKAFKRATIEVSGEKDQTFDMKVDFDYNELGNPRTIWYTPEIYSTLSSSTYSVDKWGEMIYGASTVANRAPVYLQGLGTNMSYKFLSNEAYRSQHIIQNIITDYEALSRRV